MPNLSDCDILIIANSFYNKLKYIDKSYAEKIFDQIRNRFCTGLKIIYVMEETIDCKSIELRFVTPSISSSNQTYQYATISNQFWSPIKFNIVKITPGKRIKYVHTGDYKQYLSKIKDWYLKLNTMDLLKIKLTCYDDSTESIPSISQTKLMTNNSNELLSCTLYVSDLRYKGRLYLLPPIDNAVELILESMAPVCEEPVPDWVHGISLPEVTEIKKNIDDAIRVIGGQAVHPLTINLDDDVDLAQILFNIINHIVQKLYTDEKEFEKISKLISKPKKDAIKKRDTDKS